MIIDEEYEEYEAIRREMIRRKLYWLAVMDMYPIRPQPRSRWDDLIGFLLCAPLYGYGLYKLIFG